ncbi:MAG: polysulfide reductase NrfD [Candidatus Eremiobacteraeota bacterium]|nr:polysulfide reductase NrfD [Candidatus Eremiobacteraeota bacterium]
MSRRHLYRRATVAYHRALNYLVFLGRCGSELLVGGPGYFAWMGILMTLALLGLNAYCRQIVYGLYTTAMTDQVSWGIYIANFTFLVGMAASSVMLVIPVYIYKDEALKHVVILGELLAVACITMCLLFVTVDLGRPDRFWHLVPGLGKFHWPVSMLTWDVIVLNGYLLLNAWICGYLIYAEYRQRKPTRRFYIPFVFISVFWALSIQGVEAFLYVGLGGRPFWNSAVIAPRFLASAFASGPAFLVLTLQLIRRFTSYEVEDAALLRLRQVIQISMVFTVFLLICELFTEFYTGANHVVSVMYLFFGLDGHYGLVSWIWVALVCEVTALVLLLLPVSRSLLYLDIACVFVVVGIWIDKGMGLIVPAFIPTPLGEIVEYQPTLNEWLVSWGIWAFGLMLYTAFLKMTIPVLTGKLRLHQANRMPHALTHAPSKELVAPAATAEG